MDYLGFKADNEDLILEDENLEVEQSLDEIIVEENLPINHFSRFALKDYGFQCGENLHCRFKYIAVVYDQMCDCINESDGQVSTLTCEGKFDNLGIVEFDGEDFTRLLQDVNFEFDSDIPMDLGLIAQSLKDYLQSWCKKVSKISVNTDFAYQTRLDLYDSEMIIELLNEIRLHDPSYSKEALKRLKYSVLDVEVVFKELQYYRLRDIGLNLTYCNFLIHKFLQKYYATCGFYLSDFSVSPKNVPFSQETSAKSAFCHLYLVPLNLNKNYYEYGKKND